MSGTSWAPRTSCRRSSRPCAPILRRNQRGPGFSVGVDYLAKKWDISEADVIGALKECGLEIPDDEDAKPVYVDYDGDLYWVNINRRGELWVNTKEKSRPVFRTVQAARVEPEEGACRGPRPPGRGRSADPSRRGMTARRSPGAPAAALPQGEALLERIRPQMRRNRREPGGSGSVSFLSRALKCSETALVEAFNAMGLASPGDAGDSPVQREIGDELWWLNKDQRGGIWINAREKAAGGARGARNRRCRTPRPRRRATCSPPSGSFSRRPRREGSRRPWIALRASWASRSTSCSAPFRSSGLRVPKKPRERPAFAEHAGEIFWLNLNAKGELWLNAKASKYSGGQDGESARRGSRRPRPKGKEPADGNATPAATRRKRRCRGGGARAPRRTLRRGQPETAPEPPPEAPPARRRAEAGAPPAGRALRPGPCGARPQRPPAGRVAGSVFSHERQASVTLRPAHERVRAVVLRTPEQVALDHDRRDGAVAGGDPRCQVGGHHALALGVLSAVAVAAVHHEVRGKPARAREARRPTGRPRPSSSDRSTPRGARGGCRRSPSSPCRPASPSRVSEGNQWGWRADRIASTATWTFPSVRFLNPTGIERPEASSRCTWLSTVRAPMAPQLTRSA